MRSNCVSYEFSFLFWIIPLDGWSWTLLGISSIILTAVLHGNWFDVFAILMRQSFTKLNSHKSFIIFILGAIIFTYGYEGVFSSFLTVPPPYVIMKTLRESFERGLKLMMVRKLDATNPVNQDIFAGENISLSRIDDIIVPLKRFSSNKYSDTLAQLANCNVTYCGPDLQIMRWHAERFNSKVRIKCHFIRDTVVRLVELYTFWGDSKLALEQVTIRMMESGLWSMYHNYSDFSRDYRTRRNQELDAYKERQPLAFDFSSRPLVSIFIVWIAVLGAAGLVMILEIMYARFIRPLSIRSIILRSSYKFSLQAWLIQQRTVTWITLGLSGILWLPLKTMIQNC